jgi:hypothetical protein
MLSNKYVRFVLGTLILGVFAMGVIWVYGKVSARIALAPKAG